MDGKLSDWVIMSDVDGTLLDENGELPKRNVDAINRFTRKGGRFAIASGRSRQLVAELVGELPVNYPCIVNNGGMVVDYMSGETYFEIYLPQASAAYIYDITEKFPDLGVLVVNNDGYIKTQWEADTSMLSKSHDRHFFKADSIDCIAGGWYKMLLLIPDNRLADVQAYAQKRRYSGVRFVSTHPNALEMLPEESSKGFALQILLERVGTPRERMAAIGDYYNDLEMLRQSGFGVTLSSSPDELKAVADLVVGDCNNGAVADLIEYLESRYD